MSSPLLRKSASAAGCEHPSFPPNCAPKKGPRYLPLTGGGGIEDLLTKKATKNCFYLTQPRKPAAATPEM